VNAKRSSVVSGQWSVFADGKPAEREGLITPPARQWRDEHLGKWFSAPKLSGFCLLMKPDVYDAIGGLDERFGIGFFDDDDLAERARRAGFELAVAHDLFVHHFGSRTFAGNGIDAGRLPVPRGWNSIPMMPSCGFARRSCIGTGANHPRLSGAGG
jgi:hypothetical protein